MRPTHGGGCYRRLSPTRRPEAGCQRLPVFLCLRVLSGRELFARGLDVQGTEQPQEGASDTKLVVVAPL